jgi:hypothetical protein
MNAECSPTGYEGSEKDRFLVTLDGIRVDYVTRVPLSQRA